MFDLPTLTPIRRRPTPAPIADVYAAARAAWQQSPALARVLPGQRIAVGVGSRGVADLATLVRATVDVVRSRGASPVIVPAMGSHGGATPQGQTALLADYGVTEATMDAPVAADMAVTPVGTNDLGDPVLWSAEALRADGVLVVARVKPHTDIRAEYESGVVKMLVIGLGKHAGAAAAHSRGAPGLKATLPASARVLLAKTRFLGGLATLEDECDRTAHLEAIDRDAILEREPILLERSRGMMGRLPFDTLDVLVVGEVGKNYSGCGIDPNVVGRFLVESCPEMEPATPRITRIVALALSPESHGNGVGVGMADITTDAFLASINHAVMRTNVLTARFLWRAKLPFAFPTDAAAIRAGIDTCWQPDTARLRLALIPNTLEVSELWVTPTLAAEVPDGWEGHGEARPLPLDSAGRLDSVVLFPHSVAARRG